MRAWRVVAGAAVFLLLWPVMFLCDVGCSVGRLSQAVGLVAAEEAVKALNWIGGRS